MYNKKVCILGAGKVGKTSLIQRLLTKKFCETCQASDGADIDKIVVDVDREKVQLMLWDIQGEDHQPRRFLNYLKGASAIVYVVDGTRLETLPTAMEFRAGTERFLGKAVPDIMLFNKADLVSRWEVSPGIISDIESDGIFSILTSCKEGTGVSTAFDLIARVMMGKTSFMTTMPVPSSPQNTDTRMPVGI